MDKIYEISHDDDMEWSSKFRMRIGDCGTRNRPTYIIFIMKIVHTVHSVSNFCERQKKSAGNLKIDPNGVLVLHDIQCHPFIVGVGP